MLFYTSHIMYLSNREVPTCEYRYTATDMNHDTKTTRYDQLRDDFWTNSRMTSPRDKTVFGDSRKSRNSRTQIFTGYNFLSLYVYY
jgi:hypothetical protein